MDLYSHQNIETTKSNISSYIPQTPDKWHNGISTGYIIESTTSRPPMEIRRCKLRLTLMFLDRDHLRDRSLEDTDVAAQAIASVFCSDSLRGLPYPFNNPPRARPSNATGKLGAKPKINMLRPVPANPVINTGLRPTRSLSFPQTTPVENSAKAKAEVTIPA